jgi:acetyl coenzyme A synthetase (ADP forming)-like protein
MPVRDETQVLRDGTVVVLRPYVEADRDLLEVMTERLGPESRRLRFHSAGVRVLPERLLGGAGSRSFCAIARGELLGVASYAPLRDPEIAEMAVAVADDVHGRGVGTLLFERIATAARTEGIERFLALVLPENRGMLDLLGQLGFSSKRVLGQGEIEVEVDLTPTAAYLDAVDARRHVAAGASLQPIFEPRAVAVIGASRNPESVGHVILRNLLAADPSCPIYPVNPSATAVAGVPAVGRIGDVPSPVDLAVVCVPAARVIQVAEECAAAGVRGMVVITAGFAEASAEGAEAQDRLLQICRGAGIRLVGPNCLGILSNRRGAVIDATFAATRPEPGNVAVSSQSGALGIAILERARSLGIGVSAFASIGNRADVSGNDLLERFEDDPDTDVIAMYLESFGNPRRFARICRRVAARKPIVCVKSGATKAGARAAASHTAALAASDAAVDGLFRQAGVIRTQTLSEFLDAISLLAKQPLPAGNRVAVLTNAGGLGILCADAAAAAGLELPDLEPTTRERLRAFLPAAASLGNPVDMLASAGPDAYANTVRIVASDPRVDAVIALFARPLGPDQDEVARAIRAEVEDGLEKPLATCFVSSSGTPDALNPPGVYSQIPSFDVPEDAARALGHAATLAAYRRRPRGDMPDFDDVDTSAARRICEAALADADSAWLPIPDAFALLEAYRVAVPPYRFARTVVEARDAATALGGPLAVKLASRTVLHKTEVGGVVLGVEGPDAAEAAFERIRTGLASVGSAGAMDGVLLQQLAAPGIECLLGLADDPAFGPLLAFGLGGTLAELTRDVTFRVCPVTDVDADEMLAAGRARKLLAGYRGAPPGDVAALHETILRVAQVVEDVPHVAELELNPIVALPPGQGAFALDVRVRVRR